MSNYIDPLGDPLADPLVRRLTHDLTEAKEIIKDKQKSIDDLELNNKCLRDKYERLLKDNMEMAERYLSIVEKIKGIGL